MGSIIKIKRSSNPGTPGTLGQGEMAYSFASGTVSTLGDRLFIGTGTETAGNAAVHSAVGGLYYTRLIDASEPGILTTDSNSIPVLSSTGTYLFFCNCVWITRLRSSRCGLSLNPLVTHPCITATSELQYRLCCISKT